MKKTKGITAIMCGLALGMLSQDSLAPSYHAMSASRPGAIESRLSSKERFMFPDNLGHTLIDLNIHDGPGWIAARHEYLEQILSRAKRTVPALPSYRRLAAGQHMSKERKEDDMTAILDGIYNQMMSGKFIMEGNSPLELISLSDGLDLEVIAENGELILKKPGFVPDRETIPITYRTSSSAFLERLGSADCDGLSVLYCAIGQELGLDISMIVQLSGIEGHAYLQFIDGEDHVYYDVPLGQRIADETIERLTWAEQHYRFDGKDIISLELSNLGYAALAKNTIEKDGKGSMDSFIRSYAEQALQVKAGNFYAHYLLGIISDGPEERKKYIRSAFDLIFEDQIADTRFPHLKRWR